MSKNIQIPYELFIDLLDYFFNDNDYILDDIKNALELKLERIVAHQTFSKYKRAPQGTEREKLRQEYLDLIGMKKSFRTDTETPQDTL